MWAWEAYYSRKLWDSIDASLEPDLDGTRKSEADWCGCAGVVQRVGAGGGE